MIRIIHLSGSQQGKTATSAKSTLRVGRAADCDVRFDKERDPKVSNHHAEFLFEDGCWFVVDTASTNGTLIEGRRVAKHRLHQGEQVQIGAGGPLVRVEFDAKDNADTTTAKLAEIAAKRVAQERAKAGGMPSGKTMLIMASTIKQVQHSTKAKTAKRWVKVVARWVDVPSVPVPLMGTRTAHQKRRTNHMVNRKANPEKKTEPREAWMR